MIWGCIFHTCWPTFLYTRTTLALSITTFRSTHFCIKSDSHRKTSKEIRRTSHYSDCYLRQGVGGTEFANFVRSRTCFLRWFYKRSQTYFGQKSEEHNFSIKNTLSGGKYFFEKYAPLKEVCFFWTFPALQGPGPGPYGPIWACSPKNQKKYVKTSPLKVPLGCLAPCLKLQSGQAVYHSGFEIWDEIWK